MASDLSSGVASRRFQTLTLPHPAILSLVVHSGKRKEIHLSLVIVVLTGAQNSSATCELQQNHLIMSGRNRKCARIAVVQITTCNTTCLRFGLLYDMLFLDLSKIKKSA